MCAAARKMLRSDLRRCAPCRRFPGRGAFVVVLFFVLFYHYQKWLCDQTDSEKITKKKFILR